MRCFLCVVHRTSRYKEVSLYTCNAAHMSIRSIWWTPGESARVDDLRNRSSLTLYAKTWLYSGVSAIFSTCTNTVSFLWNHRYNVLTADRVWSIVCWLKRICLSTLRTLFTAPWGSSRISARRRSLNESLRYQLFDFRFLKLYS